MLWYSADPGRFPCQLTDFRAAGPARTCAATCSRTAGQRGSKHTGADVVVIVDLGGLLAEVWAEEGYLAPEKSRRPATLLRPMSMSDTGKSQNSTTRSTRIPGLGNIKSLLDQALAVVVKGVLQSSTGG